MSLEKSISYSVDSDGIATILLDLENEKVNKISKEVGERFVQVLLEIKKNKNIKGVVISSGKPGMFIAGADIEEFTKIKDKEDAYRLSSEAQLLVNELEDLGIPTVAAIDGACLGGGLEVALGCTARVASDSSKTVIGAPEVMLGIIPGMGGCVRTPKLIGLEQALGLILSGQPIGAEKAKRIGLVDKVVPSDEIINAAKRILKNLPKRKPPFSIKSFLLEKNPIGRKVVAAMACKGVMAKTHGNYPAPIKAIDVVMRSYSKSRDEALDLEAHAFADMAVTDVSKNLVGLFFLQENAKKESGDHPEAKAHPIKSVGVLGAGIMGGGIGYLATTRGMDVKIKDVSDDALRHAYKHAEELYGKQVLRRKLAQEDAESKLSLMRSTKNYDDLKDVDLVIEAVPEKLDLKHRVYRELCDKISDKAIIASNTSTFALEALKPAVKNPERFVGLHFFNPVHKLPLLEVVQTRDSSPDAVLTALRFGQKLGKLTLLCNDGPGFVANRLIGPLMNEASWLVAEGASVEEVDKTMVRFGYLSGPLRTSDEVGLDTCSHVAMSFYNSFGERMKPSPVVDIIVKHGRLGKKNGKGIYLYSGKKPGRIVDPGIYNEISMFPRKPKGAFGANNIIERLIYCQVNEGARLLEEGVARKPRDIDFASIFGLGFPPFRGGLLTYADSVGISKIVNKLKALEDMHGPRFTPCARIIEMAQKNRTFT